MKTLITIFLTFFLIVIFPIMILTGFLGFISETLATASTCIAFLSLYFGFGFLLFKIRLGNKALFRISVSLFILSLISIVISVSSIPSGKTNNKFGLKSHYTIESKFCLITKLIREIDQVKFGATLIPFADEFIDEEKGARLKDHILEAYTEMQSDPDFVNVGSVTYHALFEIMGWNFDTGHIYVYTPEHDESEKLPVILFLHGSLGNFKIFTWILKQFADKYKYAIVAPSHGEGNWDLNNGVAVIENARNYCVNKLNMDENRIILVGLSNGGLGITRAAMENPEYYQGLIYISSILESDLVSSDEFLKNMKEKPILVIHGTKDLRIPKPKIDDAIDVLNANDINPRVEYLKDEDHFLFLSKKDEMLEMIYNWIEGLK